MRVSTLFWNLTLAETDDLVEKAGRPVASILNWLRRESKEGTVTVVVEGPIKRLEPVANWRAGVLIGGESLKTHWQHN